jgi:shikimate dehydrogenase
MKKMKRVFLIGQPVAHSVSPAMQNAALRAHGLDWRYELLETPRAHLPAAIQRVRADDCAGANVTIPHKESVVEFLDDVTPAARQIGAVNTIVKRDGKLIGENTDGYGALQTLREARVELRDARIIVLGAGGAARAAVFAFAAAGVQSIGIINRTSARAVALANSLRAHFPRLALTINQHEWIGDAELVVNATSVGMTPRVDESPMPTGIALPRGAATFDMVYRPQETRFLRDAGKSGAHTIGGLSMLAHQGAVAFTLWTGRAAPVQVMFDAARRALES